MKVCLPKKNVLAVVAARFFVHTSIPHTSIPSNNFSVKFSMK